jgi:hypothetical protein
VRLGAPFFRFSIASKNKIKTVRQGAPYGRRARPDQAGVNWPASRPERRHVVTSYRVAIRLCRVVRDHWCAIFQRSCRRRT